MGGGGVPREGARHIIRQKKHSHKPQTTTNITQNYLEIRDWHLECSHALLGLQTKTFLLVDIFTFNYSVVTILNSEHAGRLKSHSTVTR